MGGEPSGREKSLAEGVAEKEMAGLLGPVRRHRRSRLVAANFFERPRDALGIPRKLDGGGVRQKLALAGDGGLDEPPAEKPGEPDDHEGEAQHEEGHSAPSAPTPSPNVQGIHEVAARDADEENAVQHADEADVEAHVLVQDVAELVRDHALQFVAVE